MACSKKVTLSKKRHIILFFFYFSCKKIVSCLVLKFQVSKLKNAIEVTKLSILNFSNTFPLDHIINFFLDHPVSIFQHCNRNIKRHVLYMIFFHQGVIKVLRWGLYQNKISSGAYSGVATASAVLHHIAKVTINNFVNLYT